MWAWRAQGSDFLQVYRRLEDFFELVVANAQHIKTVPGRKTDVQDAEWIADLLQHELLSASFVPCQEQQELRDLTRLRVSLVQERARLVNRVQKVLEEAGIKLSCVLSDVMGASGRAIREALSAGESDPIRLAQRMRPNVQAKEEQVVAALTGDLKEHHRFLLRELLSLIDAHTLSIKHVEQEIERHVSPFEEQIERCEHITGVSRQVIQVLMAEVGTDLSRFPDAEHLSSWAGVCPGHKESAGKRLSGRCKQGNRYVRATLVQAARARSSHENLFGRAVSSPEKTSGK